MKNLYKNILSLSSLCIALSSTYLSAAKQDPQGGEIGQAREIELGRKRNGGEIGQARYKEFASQTKGLSFMAPKTWTTLENKPLLIVSDPHSTSLVDSSERISFVLVSNKTIEKANELEIELRKIHRDWAAVDIDGRKAFYRQNDTNAEVWVYRQPYQLVKIEVILSPDENITADIEYVLESLKISALR